MRCALSLELREVADVRAQYERMREDHGFRLLDYSVDADAASPRACFQFSEDAAGQAHRLLAVRRGRRPGQAGALGRGASSSASKASSTASATASRCAPALPSTVQARRWRSRAEFNIYVRDRKPLVRFTGKAYVLPRTGQRGIPVVSVNTKAVAIEIYRIGDRNLLDTVLGSDFQRTLDRYDIERLTESAARRSGRASSRSSRRSTPTSPRRSRSTRRSAIWRPASM